MTVENAWNPLIVALVATIALGLQVVAGFVNCDFVKVTADDNEVLAITETSAQEVANQTSMGLLCDGNFYDLEDDDMRTYSKLFYYGATGLGGLCVLCAWAISTCFTPTTCAWRVVPILSSLSALSSLPTFLILETHPCEDFPEQSCSLSWDSYYLMAAVVFYVVVTALTQFLDPPEWVSQLHHWRVPKVRTMETNPWSSEDDDDEDGSQDPILTPRLSASKRQWSWWGGGGGSEKTSRRKEARLEREASRAPVSYPLPTRDIEQGDSLVEEEVVSTQESEQAPEQTAQWTSFAPSTNTFRDNKPSNAFTEDTNQNFTETSEPAWRTTTSRTTTSRDASMPPASLAPPSIAEPDRSVESTSFRAPATPPIAHYQIEQLPVSPLTHQTQDSAPASPKIERTEVQEPILRNSRVSTPSRSIGRENEVANSQLNETELTTPVKRLNWAVEESILDCENGEESILDNSMDRSSDGPPFIPSTEDSKRMAEMGDMIYADLLKEDEEKISKAKETGPREYNIDELVNRTVSDSSMDASILGSEDVQAIALEGTPIYASLLLGQEDKIKRQFKNREQHTEGESPAKQQPIRVSLSSEAYSLQQMPTDEDLETPNKNQGQPNKTGKSNWKVNTPLLRNSSGYDKLDDVLTSDDELEAPPMTEVSFDPNEIQEVSLDKDELHVAKNSSEKVLLEEWNKMFDAHGPIPVKMQEADEGANDEDRKDEEELLRLISSEDFSDETPNQEEEEKNEERGEDSSNSPSSSPDKPPLSGGKTTLRPKRRARRSRSRASGSVGSAPSLLDVTIEEETPSDLEDFNKEEEPTRTPLASYAAGSSSGSRNVPTSLKMSGMHSYRSVENSGEDDLDRITAGVQEVLKRSRSRSIGGGLRSTGKAHTVRSLSPSTNRASTWRTEREDRAGIHNPAVVVSDEDDPGTAAKDLRQSRIQRLQSAESAIARARMRRDKFFGDMKPPYGAYVKRLENDESKTDYKTYTTPSTPSKQGSDPPATVSPASPGDDGSNTTTPDDVGEVGSFLLGALNLELNDLDVSLAALSRPDGSEYGPDEHSI